MQIKSVVVDTRVMESLTPHINYDGRVWSWESVELTSDRHELTLTEYRVVDFSWLLKEPKA